MTQSLAVNTSNDIYVDASGNIALAIGLDAVLQSCAQVAQVQLGEEVLNTTNGIPYQQAVWVGVPNINQFDAALQDALLSVPGVVQVVQLTSSTNNNTLSYTAVIQTIYGQGTITS